MGSNPFKKRAATRMTLCPVCLEEIGVKKLTSHLQRIHAATRFVNCTTCTETPNVGSYVGHLLRNHAQEFWIGTGVKSKQLTLVIERWYTLKPERKSLYICSACNAEVPYNELFLHQKKVHGIDYLNTKVIGTMQPDRLGTADESRVDANTLKQSAKEKLTVRGVVPLSVCQQLIINSAYWYSHTRGSPAQAAKHQNNITYGKYTGGRISFGANTFLIQKAAERLIALLEVRTDEHGRFLVDPAVFYQEAKEIVASSVKGMNGKRYSKYPIQEDGHMLFGTQSIHVPSFIKTFTDEFRIRNRIPV